MGGPLKHALIVIIIVLLLSACAAPTQAPTATVAPVPPTATMEPSPTATEKPLTLQEKVDAFAAGQIEFPTALSPEEYSAFIDEMNNHVGRQAIWVDTFKSKDKSPVVLYFDIAQSEMVELPGTYKENREVIDQNQLEMFFKISEEAETGNLQYINSNGELITSPNSADVNWNLRVDASNYEDGLIDLPEVTGSASEPPDENYWKGVLVELNDEIVFIPGILIDDAVSMLVSFQGRWNEYPCLNMLFIVTDKQGKPLYGIRTFVGNSPVMFAGNEGGTLDMSSSKIQLLNSNETRKLESGAVYYVSFANQQKVWEEYKRANIDELQGTGAAVNSFNNAFNQDVPNDGNIILAGMFFIKKK